MAVEKKESLLYQDIIEEMSYESLPSEWLRTNLSSFSDNVTLFGYQRDALKSSLKLLNYYYENIQKFEQNENDFAMIERKKKYFHELRKYEKDLLESLGISNKGNKLLFNKLKQYYPIIKDNSDERIHFLHFVNRMSFWMATGSGKTVILIKLIELLDRLKMAGLIPDNDIMILTHRDDLVEQIKEHIQEFNQKSQRKIMVWDLRKFEDVKHGTVLAFKEDINIFIYRSDLIAEKTKEKQLGFEDVENGGQWYLLLDEAHKGEKEDSKRQLYYSLFTRNGFLFNFSATFTDPWDILTTVFNFNLDTFIKKGYGKNVYLSQQELNAFQDKTDFNDRDKQRIVLKSLVLLTLSKNAKSHIDGAIDIKNYHNPLLVSLVNSVNVKNSDLEIFFKELERIASEEVDKQLFEEAKEELTKELKNHPQYIFESEWSESIIITDKQIKSIQLKNIRKNIFHSERKGSIEVKKIPGNDKELIFKLKTADLPFALMKIGDCGKWVREKLTTYHIEETYDNVSYFEQLDEDNNHINILMGSRAFYEGWDSNRPNVMLFINIGKGDAKKYVIQSVGRGVRIEPLKNKRKRLLPLRRENDVTAKEAYAQLEPSDVSLIETLFVMGTSKENVQQILDSTKYESKASGEIIQLKKNPMSKEKTLLIPVYKKRSKAVSVDELPKFEGNKELLNEFTDWVEDDRVLYALYSDMPVANPVTIQRTKDFLANGNFLKGEGTDAYYQLSKLMNHVNVQLRDIDDFEVLSDEIVHFKRIRVILSVREREKLKELIDKVAQYEDPSGREAELKKLLRDDKIDVDQFTEELKKLSQSSMEEEFITSSSTLKIKNILNHYYIPVIVSDKEKVNYINHIININSEKRFLEKLEKYIGDDKNKMKEFDWWMFSKLDEHLDEIHIPYYNKAHNKIERFKPDFIFWLKKDDEYYILFVDPKGTKHTDYQFKVDGYKQIFEEKGREKVFSSNGNNIRVHLFLVTDDRNQLSDGYKQYWFDDVENMITQLVS